MEFTMHLYEDEFNSLTKIRNGEKTIDLRVYDEKRRKVKLGDHIRFCNYDDEDDYVLTEVIGLSVFRSFADLYKSLPLTACGYSEDEVRHASPADMNYWHADEISNGVVGIHIRLL